MTKTTTSKQTFASYAAYTGMAVLSYRTAAACRAAQTRLKRRWRAAGSYGCDKGALDYALQRCEMRVDDFRAVENGWIPSVPDESRQLF